MTMIESDRFYIFIRYLIIIIMIPYLGKVQTLSENSDLYLRNVIGELQFLNDFDSIPESNSLNHQIQKNLTFFNSKPQIIDRQILEFPKYDLQKIITKVPSNLKSVGPRGPMVLGFTRNELSEMYRKAIEQGAPVKYNALLDVLNNNNNNNVNIPQAPPSSPNYYDVDEDEVPPDEIEEPVVAAPPPPPATLPPQYTYFFFPLQSFRPQIPYYNSRPVTDNKFASSSKKEMTTMNSIFFGMGSFIGMALFLLLGIFIYPRLVYYFHFPFNATSRATYKDLSEISSLVTDSINYYKKKQSHYNPLSKTKIKFKT